MKDTLSTHEAARELGINPETIRRWLETGVLVAGHRVKLRGGKVGGRYRVTREALEEFERACNPGRAKPEGRIEDEREKALNLAARKRVRKRLGLG